ncbi:MAG: hypothetical protein CMP23_00335 [Rickettsiales bacterium]|nr:hypothetical protein [Rickettsiales bacterium]
MSRTELLRRWMQISVFLYIGSGTAFAVAPNGVFSGLDDAMRLLPWFANWPPMPRTEAFAWTALAMANMTSLIACCTLVWRDPYRFRDVTVIVLISKVTTSLGGLIALILHAKYPLYVLFFAADFPVFLFTGLLWWWAVQEQQGAEP